jgi:hypothetical protein
MDPVSFRTTLGCSSDGADVDGTAAVVVAAEDDVNGAVAADVDGTAVVVDSAAAVVVAAEDDVNGAVAADVDGTAVVVDSAAAVVVAAEDDVNVGVDVDGVADVDVDSAAAVVKTKAVSELPAMTPMRRQPPAPHTQQTTRRTPQTQKRHTIAHTHQPKQQPLKTT